MIVMIASLAKRSDTFLIGKQTTLQKKRNTLRRKWEKRQNKTETFFCKRNFFVWQW